MKLWLKNTLLILATIIICLVPLLVLNNSAFEGADGLAEEAITEVNPDYEVWFEPIIKPASGEIESLLFALQAAIGAGVIGYIIGNMVGRYKKEKDVE